MKNFERETGGVFAKKNDAGLLKAPKKHFTWIICDMIKNASNSDALRAKRLIGFYATHLPVISDLTVIEPPRGRPVGGGGVHQKINRVQ